MSALIMYQGLEERFRTISGLTNILLGEPTSVHATPALYTALLRFERSTSGNVTTMRYFFIHRLIVQAQGNPQAEMQILTFLNAIPAAIDQSYNLGGRIIEGLAQIKAGDTGFVKIGETLYRVCDFVTDIKENGAAKGGI